MWRDPRIDPRPGDVTMHVGDYPTVFVVTKRDVDVVWFSQIAMKTGRSYENEPPAVERWAMESKNEKVLHAAD